MADFFQKALDERRSLEEILLNLRGRYKRRPNRELAERIKNVEAEISARKAADQITPSTDI
jgi:hypothetical protein